MKNLLIFLLLCGVCLGAEVTVTTWAELVTALGNNDTPIHLNAATFTMTGGVVADYAGGVCVIDIAHSGDVTIDGDGTGSNIFLKNGDYTVGDSTGARRLIFDKQNGDGLTFQCDTHDTEGTFYYCTFQNAKLANGFEVIGHASYDILATMNNCQANNNAADGFNIKTGTVQKDELFLNNCSATGNGDDGATSHSDNQMIFVDGGEYYANVTGLNPIGASEMYVTGGCLIHDNTAHQVDVANSAVCFIDNAEIYNIAASFRAIQHNSTGALSVRNVYFHDDQATSANWIFAVPAGVLIENCIFDTSNTSVAYFIQCGVDCRPVITNNTFYNGARGIRLDGRYGQFTNNIFSDLTIGILNNGESGIYDKSIAGYNNFWNVTTPLSNAGSLKSTDTQVDPSFTNPDNGDFTPNNPLLWDDGEYIGGVNPLVGPIRGIFGNKNSIYTD